MLNRRELLIAGTASLIAHALLLTLGAITTNAAETEPPTKEELVYHDYGSNNTNTGVCCYAYNSKGFSVHFKSGPKRYWYSKEIFGETNINTLIRRAESGKGLNSYINFLRSWPRAPKIQSTPTMIYCGPEGGEEADAYPIDTRARAAAALSYAHWAKNPDGIRRCVCKWYPDFPTCAKLRR